MPLLHRRRVLLAKTETTYGVDPTPTGAANAILVNDLNVTPIDSDLVDRDLVRPFIGRSEQLMAGVRSMIEFKVEMQGAGAAGTAPAYGPLLLACGFAATTQAGVSVTYTPVSSAFSSATMYFYVDGVLHKMTGARGTVSMGLTVKQIPYFTFKFTGLYQIVTDAAVATPTYTGFITPLPVTNLNTTPFTFHGVSPVMSELSIDLNNEVVHRTLVGGTENVIIVDREPQGSIMIESDLMAFKNWFTTAANNTLGALSIRHGTVAGQRVTLSAPNVQLTNPKYEEMDGISMLQMGLNLVPGANGNDELTILVS